MRKRRVKKSEKGTFEFSKDGSFVTLSPTPADKEGLKKIFFLTEGSVYSSESTTDRSMKPKYKLAKK